MSAKVKNKKAKLDALDKIAAKRSPGHQETSYSCGAASLGYALCAIGIEVKEEKLRDLSDTTRDGADENQLGTALEELDVDYSEDHEASFAGLMKTLRSGRPCLLCVDDWEHWVAVIGALGDYVVMRDPQNTSENIAANTVHVLDEEELTKRWRGPDDKFYLLKVEE